jgi:hypothetical protein
MRAVRDICRAGLTASLLCSFALADEPETGKTGQAVAGALEFKEEVVAGGPDDFMEVRHLVLRGSNFEIGKKLAEIARDRHRSGPIPYPSRRHTRAQLRYFEKNYPVYVERMRGVGAAFGTKLENDMLNHAGLFYGFALPGCSVVYYPPSSTADGYGVLSRNFDFSTGLLGQTKPPDGVLPVCARPYVIEMYPDEGYATLALCCYDLLGGVCDGVNSEGLTVAILGDDDLIKEYGMQPAPGFQAGFNEIQILRFLLDTCATVDEAKDALLGAKLYYALAPNHYIIADRHGDAFVWENSRVMHHGHIIPAGGKPLATTNFLLHMHPDLEALPEEEHAYGHFNRFRAIRKRLSEHGDTCDTDFMKETSRCVQIKNSPPEPYVPARTLWHALYRPEERSVEIDFYLGETKDSSSPAGVQIRRSGYKRFRLSE